MPNRRNFLLTLLSLPLINKLVPSVGVDWAKGKDYTAFYGGMRGGGKTAGMLFGIPYHENNGTIGTWCGINRSSPETQKAILDMVKKLQEDKSWQ